MKYTFLLCTLVLTGCATYNETFDCEPSKGVGCNSLSQVNRMVDEGALPFSEEKLVIPRPLMASQGKLRVWIAGHTGAEVITHEPSVVYVPLSEKTP